MIQIILKDGTKKRFTKKIIGINKEDIVFQKKLTEKEILKIPVKKNGKWKFIDPSTFPRDKEIIKDNIISLQMRIDAGEKHNFDMNKYKKEILLLKKELNDEGENNE